MKHVARVIKDICTVKNGNDFCESKTLAFIAFFVYLGFAGYMLWQTKEHFSLSEFALGIGTIIGSGAAGAAIKNNTEPE